MTTETPTAPPTAPRDVVAVLIEEAVARRNELAAVCAAGMDEGLGGAMLGQLEAQLAIAVLLQRRDERGQRLDGKLSALLPRLEAVLSGNGVPQADQPDMAQVPPAQLDNLIQAISGVLAPYALADPSTIPPAVVALMGAFFGYSWNGWVIRPAAELGPDSPPGARPAASLEPAVPAAPQASAGVPVDWDSTARPPGGA